MVPSPTNPAVATSWYQACPIAETATALTSISLSSTPPAEFVGRASSQTRPTTYCEKRDVANSDDAEQREQPDAGPNGQAAPDETDDDEPGSDE